MKIGGRRYYTIMWQKVGEIVLVINQENKTTYTTCKIRKKNQNSALSNIFIKHHVIKLGQSWTGFLVRTYYLLEGLYAQITDAISRIYCRRYFVIIAQTFSQNWSTNVSQDSFPVLQFCFWNLGNIVKRSILKHIARIMIYTKSVSYTCMHGYFSVTHTQEMYVRNQIVLVFFGLAGT